MKKAIALILIMVMVLSLSSMAMAVVEAPSSSTGGTVVEDGTGAAGTTPTDGAGAPPPAGAAKPVEVAEPSAEGKAALEAAVEEQLKDKLEDGQTAKVVSTFSAKKAGRVEANASGVKKGDVVYVLYRDANGKIRVLNATALDGKVRFEIPGAGDFTIVVVDGGSATVPSTGDSNRMMKLVLAGVAALIVMTAAGVAIKRTNG